MKKILLITIFGGFILALSFFVVNPVAAEQKTNLDVCGFSYTGPSGQAQSANDWCTGIQWKNCEAEQYDFNVGNRHYHFGCKPNKTIGGCDCDPQKAYYEDIAAASLPSQASPSSGTTPPSPSVGGATPILGLQNPLGAGATFETLLNKIINFLFWVGMAVAPVMFIVAGFLYVTSAGNPQKVESAKKMMIYAVIGLVVLLLARGLVKVLESVIGVQNP